MEPRDLDGHAEVRVSIRACVTVSIIKKVGKGLGSVLDLKV